ncbi:MAG: hypothetical protein ACTSRU_11005 [Candidatus Hodarchaeales archaeon]
MGNLKIETSVVSDDRVSEIRCIVLQGETYLMGTDDLGRQVEHVVGSGWTYTKFIFE